MNLLTLSQRVVEAAGVNEAEWPLGRIAARVPDALELLAESLQAESSRPLKELLRKQFQASVVSSGGDINTADLTPLVSGDDYLLLSSLDTADIFESGVAEPALPLQRVPDRSSLALTRAPVFGYYALEGTTLYVKNVTNDVTFTAAFVPTLATLPAQLEARLITLLVTMLKGGRG